MKVGLIYSDIYLKHNHAGHPENKDRLISVMRTLDERRLTREVALIEPRRASALDVSLNHEATYVQEIADFCQAGGGYLDPDTYAIPDSYEVALYAVGGILQGIDVLLDGTLQAIFCAVRPPGHHAERSKAMGFCIFNNVAVGGFYLLQKGIDRVFIIDFDAHHGNGTQKSFYEEDRVFYFSTHEYPFYPGTGSVDEKGAGKGYGYTYNVPLPAGSGDREYKQVYSEVLPKIMLDFSPRFVLVSAGYDIHKDDPLTYLNVTTEGVGYIVESILSTCRHLNAPVLFALEGGYNLKALGDCVALTIQKMLEV